MNIKSIFVALLLSLLSTSIMAATLSGSFFHQNRAGGFLEFHFVPSADQSTGNLTVYGSTLQGEVDVMGPTRRYSVDNQGALRDVNGLQGYVIEDAKKVVITAPENWKGTYIKGH